MWHYDKVLFRVRPVYLYICLKFKRSTRFHRSKANKWFGINSLHFCFLLFFMCSYNFIVAIIKWKVIIITRTAIMYFIQRRIIGFLWRRGETEKINHTTRHRSTKVFVKWQNGPRFFLPFFSPRKTRSLFFKTFNSFVPPPIFNTLAIRAVLTQIFLAFPFSVRYILCSFSPWSFNKWWAAEKNRLIKIVQCFWNNVFSYNSSECCTLFPPRTPGSIYITTFRPEDASCSDSLFSPSVLAIAQIYRLY